MGIKCPLCERSFWRDLDKDHIKIFGRCFECDKDLWTRDEINDILRKKKHL